MKKIILALFVFLTTMGTAMAGNGDFDFTYPMGGCTVRMCGTITGWDKDGPHGTVTITITDGDGNTLTWDEPFSSKGTQSGRLDQLVPGVEPQFIHDIMSIAPPAAHRALITG